MPHEWSSFLWAADQWLIDYSLPPSDLVAVKLFAVGHALELHLKAALAKMTGSVDNAISYAHNVAALWKACKAADPAFLPNHELREAVLAVNILQAKEYEALQRDDLLHYLQFQELYVVAKHLPDLKYLGAPLKSVKGAYALAMVSHNPVWLELFRDIRGYLGPQRGLDLIAHKLEAGDLPPVAVAFLSQLLPPPPKAAA